MNATVEAAKAEFTRAKGRVAKALATTPEDKTNWSPSATSRSPLDEVAHCAMSIKGMQGWLAGEPFPFDSMAELDAFSRAKEKEFTSREQALALLEENSNGYLAWLDGLTDKQIAATFDTPMGSFPMSMAITFCADHLRSHAAQMDYIQTIYGDHDMHMG